MLNRYGVERHSKLQAYDERAIWYWSISLPSMAYNYEHGIEVIME